MRYALGVDGGGSKCDAVLIDDTGAVVGWGRGGPAHTWYDPPDVVEASYADAVGQALAGVEGARIWLAGGVRYDRVRQAIRAAGKLEAIVPAGEVEAAFACAQEEWGMVLLSGTGSFAHLSAPDGRHLHFGGMGPILGDYGSAYDIGLRGLRAAFASRWTRSRRTSLAEAVPAALGVGSLKEVFDLVYAAKSLSRRKTAALAKVVNREAEVGDAVAIRCLQRAADDLAELAEDLIHELAMEEEAFPVIASGSVAQQSRAWWEHICRRIAAVAPRSRPVIPRVRPVVGAAMIALRAMGVQWTPALMDRIVETQCPLLEAAEGGDVSTQPAV